MDKRKQKKKSIKSFINVCYIFYKTHRKERSVIPSFVLLSNATVNSEDQKQVLNVCYFLAGLKVLRIGAATREHVSICISALGFFLITVCLMNLLHYLWSRCQNSFT